jgi:hypothetical protein
MAFTTFRIDATHPILYMTGKSWRHCGRTSIFFKHRYVKMIFASKYKIEVYLEISVVSIFFALQPPLCFWWG